MKAAAIVVLLVFGIINAIIAYKKGFNPLIWFFASGLLGLIILCIIPSAKELFELEPEEYLKRKKFGNTIGLIVVSLSVIYGIVRIIF